jgi:flagellar motility protein MotE (MotC chaperone)
MSKLLRDIRLMPIVLLAIVCLFVLKTMGLFFDGGYTLGQRLGSSGTLVVTPVPIPPVTEMRSPAQPLKMPPQQDGPQLSWMQKKFGYPGGPVANAKRDGSTATGDVAITGSVGSNKAGDALAEQRDKNKQPDVPPSPESIAARGTVVSMEQQRPVSAAERAFLERLQERRQEIDARARELDLREIMLKAAEKKLETQAAADAADKTGPNGQRKEDNDSARFKSVVIMYETMKPKDAAKIFDRLDPKVLIEVASQIKPQRMSEIMAQMTPEAAERLTVEMATRSPSDRTLNPANLPKIDGRPGG